MNLLVVDIVNAVTGSDRKVCELVQFERENSRVYLQPVTGEPARIDLATGDSLVITVRSGEPANGQSRSQWESGEP